MGLMLGEFILNQFLKTEHLLFTSSYSTTSNDPTPIFYGNTGGIFSSTAGLSINSSSGAIDLSALQLEPT